MPYVACSRAVPYLFLRWRRVARTIEQNGIGGTVLDSSLPPLPSSLYFSASTTSVATRSRSRYDALHSYSTLESNERARGQLSAQHTRRGGGQLLLWIAKASGGGNQLGSRESYIALLFLDKRESSREAVALNGKVRGWRRMGEACRYCLCPSEPCRGGGQALLLKSLVSDKGNSGQD